MVKQTVNYNIDHKNMYLPIYLHRVIYLITTILICKIFSPSIPFFVGSRSTSDFNALGVSFKSTKSSAYANSSIEEFWSFIPSSFIALILKLN